MEKNFLDNLLNQGFGLAGKYFDSRKPVVTQAPASNLSQPFNWKPWAIGGAVVGGLLLLWRFVK